ncbi:MAG: hypothetical protein AB7R55_03915 [Gemmatimonadales bacterium]
MKLARRPELAEDRLLAEEEFWSDWLERLPPELVESLAEDQSLLVAFLNWLVFDFELPEGQDLTVAARLLRTRSSDLSGGERTWIERMAGSSLRLVEVVEVRLDQGLSLVDMLSGERLEVSERSATHQLGRWDVLAVRVVEGPAGRLVLEGHPYVFPRQAAVVARDEMVRRQKAFARRARGRALQGTFDKTLGLVLHHLWLELVFAAPMPRVVTAEGDELRFTRLFFDVRDSERVRTTLGRHPDLDSDDDHFVWVERTTSMPRVLGSVSLKGARLILEVQSAERAARGRTMLEAALGDSVRYRLAEEQSLEQALADQQRRGPVREAPEIPLEIEQRVVGDFLERHYASWVDEPIPALGGRTPRHAARLKTVRPKVIELLKQIENGLARERAAGRPAIDLAWLWAELGLTRE